tara:strand:- start:57 stop:2057 length:2001 start_codon:yes stop_codon:yes gene_type:complete
MTTPSNTGWYFMSIPNDQSIRFYVQKTLDASNLDISLICVPLNKDVVRNDNENEMTDISLSNFVSSLNYNDGPVENYGEFTVNDWGKLSIFDYDTKLSLPSGISSIPCWVLLKNKVVPSLVIDTSAVDLKEYFGINFDPNTVLNLDQELNRPTKNYVRNKLYLNFPESTQIQKISYGGHITALNGISNENIVYESIIHNNVYNDVDVDGNPISEANYNDYYHYHWFDNYKYPTELYKADDIRDELFHIRNKSYMDEAGATDAEKYDFTKMNNYSNDDTYLTVGDISYGVVSNPNVLVENVIDNSWNYDFSGSIWEPYIWEDVTGKTKSIINWMDISLGHKPLRWGPADRKEHIANKDENLEILQLILDTDSTGTIEISYGNDLDNQIYYQKLYVNQGEISMNLVRHIPAGLVMNVSTGAVYLKGEIPRKPALLLDGSIQYEKCYVEVCEFYWFSRGEGRGVDGNSSGNKCGTNNEALTDLDIRNKLIAFNSYISNDTNTIIQDMDAINNVITNNQLTVNAGDGTEASNSSWVDNITKITRDNPVLGVNGIITANAVLYKIKFDGVSNGFDSLGSKESSSDSLCQANEQLRIFSFNPQYISFMKDNPPNQVYLSIKYANTESRGNQYYSLSEYEYMFTPDKFPPKNLTDNSNLDESGFFPLTIIEDL